jgi:hypothetical protein
MNEPVDPPSRASASLLRNCRFAFRCTQQWDTLSDTEDPRKRFCGECERRVVRCESDDELRAALGRNDCVAIPAVLLSIGTAIADAMPCFVGEVAQEYGRE